MDLDACDVHEIDFGKVKFGSTHTRTFSDPHFCKICEIKQYTDSCSIDNKFKINTDEKDSSIVKLNFIPDRPKAFHCSYFKIVNADRSKYIVCAKGSTEDLIVTASKKKIEIKASKVGKTISMMVELQNKSKSSTTFQFQHDQNQSDFYIEPKEGRLAHGETLKVILTFKSLKSGVQYRTLHCFLHHHAPIVIEVITICEVPSKQSLQNKLYFIEPVPKIEQTYSYFFQSSIKIDFNPADYPHLLNPPIILDKQYLDLGSKSQSSGDAAATTSFHVINLSPVNILVKWHTENNNVFKVEPAKAVVETGSKYKFVVLFNPTSNDNFFSSILEVSLHWGTKYAYVVPYYTSVHVVGNTFEPGNFGWLGEYKMPQKIVLPPTLPGVKAWTTFIIRRFGHLPLMFRLLPMDGSQYKIEPECGVIEGDLQIFVVEFTPGLISGRTHTEQRTIILNTSIAEQLEIIGSVENPNLWFPHGDRIEFSPTTLNCSLESYLQVKNVTRHLIRFNFEVLKDDLIKNSSPNDTILPGEQTRLWLTFSPKTLGVYNVNRFLSLSCQQQMDSKKQFKNYHLVEITGLSVHPQLECVPVNLLAREVHRDEIIEDFFVITNTGDCTCFIKLRVISKEPLSSFRQFDFNPECFTLYPGDDLKVNITVVADTSGYQSFEVLAVIFQTPSFDNSEEVCSIHLLNVNFFCHSYRFKIVDVVNLDGDEISVPKFHLWNILNIDGWNEKLKKASTDFTLENIEMKVPEFELGEKVLRISIIFENFSDDPCTLQVVKSTPCDCPLYTTKTGIILIRPDSLCPHRSQVYFDPPSEEFKVKERKAVTMTVLYNDSTVSLSTFRISIFCTSHPSVKHTLNLYLTRNIIECDEVSADICQYDAYKNSMSIYLENVFIAMPSPPIQAVWFYNNCCQEVEYRTSFEGADKEYFECLNPAGQIPSYSIFPILLRFSPLSPTEYEVKLHCNLGERNKVITLKARGVLNHPRNPLLTCTKMPFSSDWTSNTCPIYLSSNHLTIDNMTTHACTKRIFQLKNDSPVQIAYKWPPFSLEDVITVTIVPETGSLTPGEAVTLNLLARSQNKSFTLTLPLTCHVIHDGSAQPPFKMRKRKTAALSKFASVVKPKDDYCMNLGCERNTTASIASFLTVTVSISCMEAEWLDKLPFGIKNSRANWKTPLTPGPCIQKWDFPPIEVPLASNLLNIFSYIILDILESKRFQPTLSERLPAKYYSDIEAAANRNQVVCSSITNQQVVDVIDTALLYSFDKLLLPSSTISKSN